MAPDYSPAPVDGGAHTLTVELFKGILNTFTVRGFSEKSALPVAYFALSTWFSACLPEAPCLLITGPGPEARLLLELLGCVVFNPLPLFELSRADFLSLNAALEPTMLLVQECMIDSFWQLMLSSNYRNAQVPGANGMHKIYCAKAIYLGPESAYADSDRNLLRIDLAPLRGCSPILEENEKKALSAEFQARIQTYRQLNFIQVRESRFDLPGLGSAIRILARVLGAPIVSAPEVQAALGHMLREYQQVIQESLWCDPKCIVIEAILFCSHQAEMERVHVGEITRVANTIRKGRGESMQLGPKEVGAIVRKLGLSATRDRKGFAIRLDESIRRNIHELASRFAVASAQEGAALCAHCAEFLRFEPGNEGLRASME